MLPTRVKPMETSPRACSTGVPAIAPALAPVGDPYVAAHDLIGYGACGIAVADLDETGQPNPTPEILVTTLNGEFVVFAQTGGVIDPTPRFHTIVDGQLGAFNSIVVGDFDPFISHEAQDVHRQLDWDPEVLCAVTDSPDGARSRWMLRREAVRRSGPRPGDGTRRVTAA